MDELFKKESLIFSENVYRAEWRGKIITVRDIENYKELVFANASGRWLFIPKSELNAGLPFEGTAVEKFIKDNNLKDYFWTNILISVPEFDNVNFHLRFDGFRSNNYVNADKTAKFIEWMKLTEELF